MNLHTPQSMQTRVGQNIGVSEWLEISQDMIDRFADLTDDHLYIHVDPVAAARGPYGSTVAHGFLVLSMIAKLVRSADFRIENTELTLNYGFDKVRIISPVKAGARIRGVFTLKGLELRGTAKWLSTLHIVIEAEGEPRPVIVADWLGMQIGCT